MVIVTLTDRPKSVRNPCVIKVLVAFCVGTLVFGFFCRCRGFCHRPESDLFPFLSYNSVNIAYSVANVVLPVTSMQIYSEHITLNLLNQKCYKVCYWPYPEIYRVNPTYFSERTLITFIDGPARTWNRQNSPAWSAAFIMQHPNDTCIKDWLCIGYSVQS